ncbi:LytTR family DNA-binding domain-containing protein [Roseovarius ramblicola]|uniref:LytTR family DNA-binding domain-containing protein n=1 Tax=Roseovarius ramblicola TaxID=2022336 RepID=A0ABV5I2Z9_9RHOB
MAETAAAVTSRITMSIWLTACLIAVVAGPFGTFQTMSFGLRLAYWGTVITSGLALGALVHAVFLTICRGWHPFWIDLKAAALITTLLAPLIFVLRAGLDPMLTRADLSPGSIWINTGLFVLPIFVLRRQLTGAERTPEPRRPRLLRRLPDALQEAEVLRLSARDHTVEVATDHGPATLRLRLKDAIDEMEPVEGVCTHRSHWVARAAITGYVSEGGKLFVTLANGDRAPVGGKYRPRLEELGLVPGQDG